MERNDQRGDSIIKTNKMKTQSTQQAPTLKGAMRKILFYFSSPFRVGACILILLLPFGEAGWGQNIAINTTGAAANASALLEVGIGTDTKGMLIPRVSLTGITDVTTIATPANALVVYNTNAAMTNGNGVGFYYYCSSGCAVTGWKFMAASGVGPGNANDVLTSQGAGTELKWAPPVVTGGGSTCMPTEVTNEINAVNGAPCTGAGCTGLTMTARNCWITCDNLVYNTFGDWRTPTIEELAMLVNITPNNTNLTYIWSSTPVFEFIGTWLVFRVSDGRWTDDSYGNTNHCRCVR